MNTDKMGKFLEHDLDHSHRVRWGIAQKFMLKAHKPEHLKTLYRCLSWLQARWNKEFNCVVTVPLCKAAYRARSPDMALRILTSPWLRILPNTNSHEWLLRTCVELNEEKLFASPAHTNYKPYPNESSVDDWVNPIAEEEEVSSSAQSYGSRHGGQKEEVKVEVKTEDFGGQDLQASFKNVVAYVHNPRHYARIEPRLYALEAEFHAINGNLEKTRELLEKVAHMTPEPIREYTKSNGTVVRTQPLVTHAILPTAYLAAGQYQQAIEEIQKIAPEALNARIRRVQIAALLALGKNDEAFTALQQTGNVNQFELLQTHLGHAERVQTIRDLYARLESEAGIQLTPAIKDYLAKLDSALPVKEEAKPE